MASTVALILGVGATSAGAGTEQLRVATNEAMPANLKSVRLMTIVGSLPA